MVDVVGITLAALLERPMRAALEQLWPPADEMRTAIDKLVSGQERQRLAPVLEAAGHLELEDFESARKCLMRAESEEPCAPVIKLALAMVLARSGRTGDPVARRITEALQMNPLLIRESRGTSSERHGATNPAQPRALPGRPPVEALVTQALESAGATGTPPPVPAGRSRKHDATELAASWDVPLTQLVTHKDRGIRLADSRRFGKLWWAAVGCTPGTTAGVVTAAWASGHPQLNGSSPSMAAFGLTSGSLLWGRTGKAADRELILAAPAALVLRARESQAAALEICSAATGDRLAEFSPDIFRLLFWPGWSDWRNLSEDIRYRRSHRQFGIRDHRYDLTRELDLHPDLDLARHAEEAQLCDPLDARSVPLVTAANAYELRRDPMGLRKIIAPGTPAGWFWSTVVSSKPPGGRLYTCHATLSRAR